VRLPDGRVIHDYHRIEHPDCSVILAQTPSGEIIVERQYKHGPGKVGLCLPEGAIDPGETPLQAAQRELLEETGYQASGWRSLGGFWMNGNYGSGCAHLLCASDARKVAAPASGDLEEMEILLMTRAELGQALLNGEVHLLSTAAVIALLGLADAKK
jgi:ADP-ribose pyrophosphatase